MLAVWYKIRYNHELFPR